MPKKHTPNNGIRVRGGGHITFRTMLSQRFGCVRAEVYVGAKIYAPKLAASLPHSLPDSARSSGQVYVDFVYVFFLLPTVMTR